MFLLCGARPYISIGWLWAWREAICFYWLAVGVGLGHMVLLCAAGPYVCIGWLCAWRWAICFNCMCGPYVFIGDCYESYHMFSLTMEPSVGHVIHFCT